MYGLSAHTIFGIKGLKWLVEDVSSSLMTMEELSNSPCQCSLLDLLTS